MVFRRLESWMEKCTEFRNQRATRDDRRVRENLDITTQTVRAAVEAMMQNQQQQQQ